MKSKRAVCIVKCIKILSSALQARAVITATFRGTALPDGKPLIYTLLSDEERWALTREFGVKIEAWAEPFPRLLRSHAICPETGQFDLSGRVGSWVSAESLWVRTDAAIAAVVGLDKWRVGRPQREGAIHAPNWRTLTAVRVLALAHGLLDPADPTDIAFPTEEVRS